jgi:hypothetical protein
MLGLNLIPCETSIPSHTRRRIWSHPELCSHSILVLSFDQLHATPLAGAPRAETLAAIESGADLEAVLGPLTTVVDLDRVRRLTLDLLTNSLNIEYAGAGNGTSRLRITFASSKAADSCFTKIWRRLGEDFGLAPYGRDAWHSIRGPLALLAVTLLTTALLAALASVHEDAATSHPVNSLTSDGVIHPSPKTRSDSLLDWLNWKVVCGLGGAVAACSQVWLYRRLTAPPVSLDLLRKF